MVERSPGLLDGVAVEILSPEFAACVDPDVVVERIWTGGVWTEGPAWLSGEGMVVWSDIPNDRMLGWSPATGAISTFRAPAHGANGNTTDAAGRLVTCEQFTRRITRTEPDGAITVLVERIGGRRLTAPNDIVVKSDGTIWFTDPDYGRGSPNYEGEVEIEGCHVYRHDPRDGSTRQMTDDMVMPNGLAFSPDESLLYVIDTGSTHREDGPNHLREFGVGPDGTLSHRRVLAEDENRQFDGLRVDAEGRLWCGVGEGVRAYDRDGVLLGRIRLPERAANLEFVGADRSMLAICGTSSLYRCAVKVRPAAGAR